MKIIAAAAAAAAAVDDDDDDDDDGGCGDDYVDYDVVQGIDVTYKIMMTNGVKGDIWHYHFSADEFGMLTSIVSVI